MGGADEGISAAYVLFVEMPQRRKKELTTKWLQLNSESVRLSVVSLSACLFVCLSTNSIPQLFDKPLFTIVIIVMFVSLKLCILELPDNDLGSNLVIVENYPFYYHFTTIAFIMICIISIIIIIIIIIIFIIIIIIIVLIISVFCGSSSSNC